MAVGSIPVDSDAVEADQEALALLRSATLLPAEPARRLSDPVRLKALATTDWIDHLPADAFQRLAQVACRALAVPGARVSFLEASHPTFWATRTPPPAWATDGPPPTPPLNEAVIETAQPLAISDNNVADAAAGTSPIRAYLGVPLLTEDGYTLGTFAVVDTQPRAWTEEDLDLMQTLALAAIAEVTVQLDRQEQSQVVEALREVTELHRMALEAAQMGAFDYDLTDGAIFWDARCRAIFGVEGEEPIDYGQAIALVHPDDRERVEWSVTQVMLPTSDGHYSEAYRVVRPDGVERWVGTKGQVHFVGKGAARRPVRYVGTVQDITDRKHAEDALLRSERHLRAVLDSLFAFVVVLAPDGTLTEANRVALASAGLRADDVLGRPFLDAYWWSYDDLVQDRLREALQRAAAGSASRYDVKIRLGQHRYITIDFLLTPLLDEDGTVTHLIASGIDITARKRMEEDLRQRNEEMEQFTYTVSHDLKSPLVTITGFIGMLRDYIEMGRVDKVDRAIERIHRSADRMGQLIDDLLELSRIGRMRGDVVRVDVNALVEELAQGLAHRLEQHNCRLTIAPDLPPVMADPKRLSELFENLLTNAIKYGGPGAHIQVDGFSTGYETCYFVEDDGPGIDPAYHEKVFGLFERLDTSQEGTGIGLAIVARIMRVHGGRAWVESGMDGGARFVIAFPEHG